jgi:hypothetical protein
MTAEEERETNPEIIASYRPRDLEYLRKKEEIQQRVDTLAAKAREAELNLHESMRKEFEQIIALENAKPEQRPEIIASLTKGKGLKGLIEELKQDEDPQIINRIKADAALSFYYYWKHYYYDKYEEAQNALEHAVSATLNGIIADTTEKSYKKQYKAKTYESILRYAITQSGLVDNEATADKMIQHTSQATSLLARMGQQEREQAEERERKAKK